MISEVEVFLHLDGVVFPFLILSNQSVRRRRAKAQSGAHPFPQIIQNLDLNQGLMMEAFLVTDDLDSHRLARAVVATLQNLSE